MNESKQNIATETEKYTPFKSYVNVYKVNSNGTKKSRQKWFEGLVTQVTSRGVFVNAMKEPPHADSTDVLCGQFVPFGIFNSDVELQIVKR